MRSVLSEAELNMIRVISAAVGTGNVENVNFDIWDETYDELCRQDVHSLIADISSDFPLDTDRMAVLTTGLGKSLTTFHNLMFEEEDVIQTLENAGIPVVVLKGAAAAFNYYNPSYRRMGDIDLIVGPEDFEKAFWVLREAGYNNEQNLDSLYKRHISFRKQGGKHIELHRHFSSSHNAEQNFILDHMIYEGIPNRQIQDICGYTVPVLPNLVNGVVLLAHINQHLLSGLGMRQIIDWMMFVEKWMDTGMWEKFSPVAESIGMKKLAVTATKLCSKYFGFRHQIDWLDSCDVDEELVDQLMIYVVDNGCFGNKHSHGKRATETVMIYLRNPVSAFKYLDAGGITHWTAARKHWYLRPFAWIYQIGHLIRKGTERKVGVTTLLTEANASRSYVEFLKKLEITRL